MSNTIPWILSILDEDDKADLISSNVSSSPSSNKSLKSGPCRSPNEAKEIFENSKLEQGYLKKDTKCPFDVDWTFQAISCDGKPLKTLEDYKARHFLHQKELRAGKETPKCFTREQIKSELATKDDEWLASVAVTSLGKPGSTPLKLTSKPWVPKEQRATPAMPQVAHFPEYNWTPGFASAPLYMNPLVPFTQDYMPTVHSPPLPVRPLSFEVESPIIKEIIRLNSSIGSPLLGLQGKVVLLASSQNGSRYLQSLIDRNPIESIGFFLNEVKCYCLFIVVEGKNGWIGTG